MKKEELEEIVEDFPNKFTNIAVALGIGFMAGITAYTLGDSHPFLNWTPALITTGYVGSMAFCKFNKNIKNKPDAYINNTLNYLGIMAGFYAPYLMEKI